jgi:hypothetical protein
MTDTESAGATPVEPGATPGQSGALPQAAPAHAAATAVAEPDADGMSTDAGRKLLRDLRAQLKGQAAELESARTSQLSDHERAIAQARREAAADAQAKANAMVRRAEVRRALQGAGVTPDSLDLAAGAPEFGALEVDADSGSVADLDKAVDAFRKAHPSLFAAARPAAGNFDGGSGGSPAQSWTAEAIGAMSQAEFERNEAEIMRAMREGRIRQ